MEKILEETHIDSETEAYCSFVSSVKNAAGEHCHDFFELFLITRGSVAHKVNGSVQRLGEGSLVFIRPWDVHYYEHDGNKDCQFFNIPYKNKGIYNAFDYLGDSLQYKQMLSAAMPPVVELSPVQSAYFARRMEKFFAMDSQDKRRIRLEFRSFLIEVLSMYFPSQPLINESPVPGWFEVLLEKLQDKEVFSEGLSKIYQLSGKSVTHVNRSFQKYCKTTPTDFINRIRLNYARNLLEGSDREILEIALDAGFNNLSHFYHLFKKHYKDSPAAFRAKVKKLVI